jgi:hypothetical protein
MKTYIIILSDVKEEDCDIKFAKFVNDNRFEYWRYTALNWILLTPDSISTNQIITKITESYGPIFQCVLEIDINDVGGLFPHKKGSVPKGWSPFLWFKKMKDPNFIPNWEKERTQDEKVKINFSDLDL